MPQRLAMDPTAIELDVSIIISTAVSGMLMEKILLSMQLPCPQSDTDKLPARDTELHQQDTDD